MKKLISMFALLMIISSCDEVTKEQTKAVQHEMDVVSNELAKDQEAQYEMALKSGDKMDAYTQAMIVAQFYLQAKDTANYKKWKKIEKKHKKEIGL